MSTVKTRARIRRGCDWPGCDRTHKAKGLCAKHYQLVRDREIKGHRYRPTPEERGCDVEDCTRPHNARGMCQMHYFRWRKYGTATPPDIRRREAGRTCSAMVAPGVRCDRRHYGRGYCQAHYQRMKAGRPVDVALWVKSNTGRTCSVEGCDNPSHSRGLCGTHYFRAVLHGDPLAVVRGPRPVCSIDQCDRPHFGNGYCKNHNESWKRTGDPLARIHTGPGRCAVTLADGAVCGVEVLARGMCMLHLRRFEANGDPLVVANRGFHAHEPALVYLIAHDELGAVKVGVANRDTRLDRLAIHRKRGWRILHVIDIADGWSALAAERRVLELWGGAAGFVSPVEMRQGGWTETISLAAYDETTALAAAGQ